MTRSASQQPELLWRAQIWADGSSAIISREMVLALDRLGVSVLIDDLNPKRTAPLLTDEQRRRKLRSLVRAEPSSAGRVRIRVSAPEPYETNLIEGVWDVDPEALANVTFLTLPNGYLPEGAKPETANKLLDQIWACSNYVAETLVEMGFARDKVRAVPLGYSPEVFHPTVRPADLQTSKSFRFIHVSIPYITYKGIDILVRAYVEEFTGDDDVCLVLQSRPRGGAEKKLVELIEQEYRRVGHRPEILFLPIGVDQATLASWYRASSCYVQTSRCEGFGMPVLEAMACGLPVVAVDFGGHLEFCSPKYAYLVDCEVGPPPEGARAERLTSITRWAYPDLAHLRHQMRYAYEHRAESVERGRAGAEAVRQSFTWTHAARTALSNLAELA